MRSIFANSAVSLRFSLALVALLACRKSPTAPTASRLEILTYPQGSTEAGQVISPPLQVAVRSSKGAGITSGSYTITMSIASGTGSADAALGGTLSRVTVNGVATFDDLTIDRVGSGYRLTAMVSGSGQSIEPATSSPFTIRPGPASRLAFSAQPGTTVAGTVFVNPVRVMVTDAFGNLVESGRHQITVAVQGVTPAPDDSTAPLRFTRSGSTVTPANPLAGTLTAESLAGIATFSNLRPRNAGDFDAASNARPRLIASAPGLAMATSDQFTVTPAPASRVWVAVPPCSGAGCAPPFPPMQGQQVGQPFQVSAYILDSLSNRTNSGSNQVTLALENNPGGATLSATQVGATANGRALFNVTLNNPGNGFTITATSAGLTGMVSYPFNVSSSSSWTQRDSLPEPRNSMFAGESGGKIYVASGTSGFPNFMSSARVYDPATNSWAALRSASIARAFSTTNSAVINGVLHLVAGNPYGTCTAEHEAYTVAADEWTSRAAAPSTRCHSATVAYNGRVYLVGGWDASSTTRYREVDVYTPGTNSWSAGVPLPAGQFRGGMAAVVHAGKLYLIGGTESTTDPCTNGVTVFDFGSGTWSNAASMSSDRCSPAATLAANGRIYVAGGRDDSGSALSSVESYDPATNSWRSEPAMAIARQGLALVAVGQTIYAIGGSSGNVSFRAVEALTVP